jgi:hypothetical protein
MKVSPDDIFRYLVESEGVSQSSAEILTHVLVESVGEEGSLKTHIDVEHVEGEDAYYVTYTDPESDEKPTHRSPPREEKPSEDVEFEASENIQKSLDLMHYYVKWYTDSELTKDELVEGAVEQVLRMVELGRQSEMAQSILSGTAEWKRGN